MIVSVSKHAGKVLGGLFLFACVIFPIGSFAQTLPVSKQPVDYANVFTGTSNSRWMLGPYACRPFGMVQLGPDNQGSQWMGGYEYAISSVTGFSHMHAWTMGGLMMMPATADPVYNNSPVDAPYKGAGAGYHSRILKETEVGAPGYYSVYLYDHKVKAEMTATTRCGYQRYTFPKDDDSRIIVDLDFPTEADYRGPVTDAQIRQVNDHEIEGYAVVNGGLWSLWQNYRLNFVIRFSKPFDSITSFNNGMVKQNIKIAKGSGDLGITLNYKTKEGEVIEAQSGISLVSIANARLNLDTEMNPFGWDFSKAVADAKKEWNDLFSTIQVESDSEKDKIKFYTNFYRAYSSKQTWNDVNGEYMDPFEKLRKVADGKNMYGGDAFWNSYWNLNLLWSVASPKKMDNWVNTELELYKYGGWTSNGPTGLEYSGIMEVSHEIPLMVSAYQKGIRKDGDAIYNAVKHTADTEGDYNYFLALRGTPGLSAYKTLGYIPSSVGPVCRTLDLAYDDFCVSQLALALGKQNDYDKFLKRSKNYKNVFNPELKWVVPRNAFGGWKSNFDLFSCVGFIEGNSWQYSWYVPHDVPGLINLMGKDLFLSRLEEGFEKAAPHKFAAHAFDRTEGQSAEYYVNHGNEVNMQAAWLFNYAGRPDLTQKYTHAIMENFYGDTPYAGWEGDEDEGQMGSWFVNTSIGLFEMDGAVTKESTVSLSSPLFKKITIKIDPAYYGTDNGKQKELVIEANNLSKENIYIQSITFNGKKLDQPFIPFLELMKGGSLVYEMSSKAN